MIKQYLTSLVVISTIFAAGVANAASSRLTVSNNTSSDLPIIITPTSGGNANDKITNVLHGPAQKKAGVAGQTKEIVVSDKDFSDVELITVAADKMTGGSCTGLKLGENYLITFTNANVGVNCVSQQQPE